MRRAGRTGACLHFDELCQRPTLRSRPPAPSRRCVHRLSRVARGCGSRGLALDQRHGRPPAQTSEPLLRYRGAPASPFRDGGLRMGTVRPIRKHAAARQDHGRPVPRHIQCAVRATDRRISAAAAEGCRHGEVALWECRPFFPAELPLAPCSDSRPTGSFRPSP